MQINSKVHLDVVGIIVSYQPNPDDLVHHVNELVEELDFIILIENGSDEIIQTQLQNALQNQKIEIIKIKENQGLARAQNIGIKRAIELGVDYFLFLDDDSSLSKGSVGILLKEFKENSKVGIAACNVQHKDSGKIQKYWIKTKFFYRRVRFIESIHKLENVNTVISSGSLISKEVIEKCGLMREDYFIDYIDIEYCLRIRANGFAITVVRSAELQHKLGNTKSISLGSMSVHPTNHSPKRRYYMIRNRIWTWKLYAMKFPGWFLIDFGNFIVDNVRMLVFEKRRWENLRFFILGLRDGFLGIGVKGRFSEGRLFLK